MKLVRGFHAIDQSSWHVDLLKDPCVYCGGTATGRDHIVPRANGGTNVWMNIAPACAKCNHDKDNLPLLLFLVTGGGRGYQPPKPKRRDLPDLRPPAPLMFSLAEVFPWRIENMEPTNPDAIIACAKCGSREWFAFPDGANSFILECPTCGTKTEIAGGPNVTLSATELPAKDDQPF